MEELKDTRQDKLTGASELADKLGITLQMLSLYVKAYSQVTKVQIKKVGRKGRHFDPLQVQILTNARQIVATNTGVTVEEAMRRALIFDSEALESAAVDIEGRYDTQALREALRAEVAGPIVEELQALKREITELKNAQAISQVDTTPGPVQSPGESSAGTASAKHTFVVRHFRKWLRID